MDLKKLEKISVLIEKNTIRISELALLVGSNKFDDKVAQIIYNRMDDLVKENDAYVTEMKKIANS